MFEKEDFNIKKLKMVKVDSDFAKKHYAEHKGKHFYNKIVDHISSGFVVAMV